jgi:hypothetical protein
LGTTARSSSSIFAITAEERKLTDVVPVV